jgi:hypothetical protein
MKFAEIDFNGERAKLLDKKSTDLLIKQLDVNYRLNVEANFKTPGHKYIKNFKPDDIEYLKRYTHLITTYNGKNPIWLLWLTTIDGIKYSFYINIAQKEIIWNNHHFATILYDGTLFEGEIIDNQFIIWDLLLHKNKLISEMLDKYDQPYNTNARNDIINEIINNRYKNDINKIKIINRQYVSYEHLYSFYQQLKPSKLLFIPIGKCVKYILIRENTEIPSIMNTISLTLNIKNEKIKFVTDKMKFWLCPVTNKRDNYQLYSIKEKELIYHELAVICSTELSHKITEIFEKNKGLKIHGITHMIEFECEYIRRFQKWQPVKKID